MFYGQLFVDSIFLLSIQLFAVFLGLWAIMVMRIGNFNITPTPVKNGVFVNNPPYKILRHPMYTSILLFVIPELIDDFSGFRLSCFSVLSITLIFKIQYEEKNLLLQFSEYSAYKNNTWRIIPFLW
ncbi:MAG: hypothetical protein B7C24_07065 [Bacteroidetes bacterium 4572_77]|nr:MAG: hypothetical protein B7C24_07065 [Bacteroidetes bacterium 4572_77]